MTDAARSWPAETFDRIYAGNADPWNFASSAYERGKYAATLAALPTRRFVAGFEVGCSIGILTCQLARRCEWLLAVDVAEAALAIARRNCVDLPHVAVRRLQIPGDWPQQKFDLIVLSEVLYFLGPDDIARTAERAAASLLPGGVALLVNWTGQTDTPCTGDHAATRFIAASGFTPARQQRQTTWRLDLLQPVP